MCGRYRLSRRKQIIKEYFETADWQDDWSPRYNIAPTQPVPVIRQHPKEPVRELALMKWGLIPNCEAVARNSAQALRTPAILSAFIADSSRFAMSNKPLFCGRSRVLMLSLFRYSARF